ncbi:hypothetical protein ACFWY5_39160 [Nonomuraea sp. NPDC059007]|uniref:hypothetical protein n=1 Tax=Nonomuraea sp. NPDC059007 TaxID=3346692 RepID=UPI0036C8B1D2
MSRRHLINGLLLAFTATFAVFSVVAPAGVVRPVALAVLGLIVGWVVAVVVWAGHVVWRRRKQNQPSA